MLKKMQMCEVSVTKIRGHRRKHEYNKNKYNRTNRQHNCENFVMTHNLPFPIRFRTAGIKVTTSKHMKVNDQLKCIDTFELKVIPQFFQLALRFFVIAKI